MQKVKRKVDNWERIGNMIKIVFSIGFATAWLTLVGYLILFA